MSATLRDIDSFVVAKPGTPSTSVTAGGTGDATEVNGPTLDRFALTQGRGQSAVLCIQITGTLGSGQTATIAANFQDSANDSDWSDFGDALAATTVLNAAGGALTARSGTIQLGVNLSGARRYIRAQVTPNLSRASTDTATFSSQIVVAGQAQLPAA